MKKHNKIKICEKVTKADKIWLVKDEYYILNSKIIIKYLNLIIIDIKIIKNLIFFKLWLKVSRYIIKIFIYVKIDKKYSEYLIIKGEFCNSSIS